MAAIPSETGNLVRWRLVSIEVNQHKVYDGFADKQVLKVFSMSMARAASQRHTEHVQRKSTAILDAYFHTDTDELIHAPPPTETEPKGIGIQLLSEQGEPHERGRRFFRNEVGDGAKCAPQSRVLGRRRQLHGGVEDGCVPKRGSVERAQGGHQVGDSH